MKIPLAVITLALSAILTSLLIPSGQALAQAATSASAATPIPAERGGPHWKELKPAQQAALKPLESEWPVINADRKRTWLEMARRFPAISAAEQSRVQDRMAEWVKMSPRQRGAARLRFQELKQLPAEDRQARWNAYQALSPEQKKEFAARAGPAARARWAAATRAELREAPLHRPILGPVANGGTLQQSITPTLVQARPGATTSLITKRPFQAWHQPLEATRFYVTPDAIDKFTLLPRRGPQSAHPFAAAAAPAPRPLGSP